DRGDRVTNIARPRVKELTIDHRNRAFAALTRLFDVSGNVTEGDHAAIAWEVARARIVDLDDVCIRERRADHLRIERLLEFIVRMEAVVAGITRRADSLLFRIEHLRVRAQ